MKISCIFGFMKKIVAKITTLCKAVNIDVEAFWLDIMTNILVGKDIVSLLSNVGTVTAAAAPVAGSGKSDKIALILPKRIMITKEIITVDLTWEIIRSLVSSNIMIELGTIS